MSVESRYPNLQPHPRTSCRISRIEFCSQKWDLTRSPSLLSQACWKHWALSSKFSCPLSSKACINTFKWHLFQCKDVLQVSKAIQINRNHWKSKRLVEKNSSILDWTRGHKDVPGAKLLTQAASASPRDMGVWKWALQRFCHVYRQNEDILLLFWGRHFGPTHNLEFGFLIISNFLSLLPSSACLWLLVWSHLSLSVFKMVVVLFKWAAIYESYPSFWN